MTTRSALLLVAVGLVGCDVKQDLGETAGSSASGSAGGESSTGGESSSASDSIGTSGTSGTSSDPTASGPVSMSSTDADESSSGSTSTGGAADACEVAETQVEWVYDGTVFLGELGANSSFSGEGFCEFAIGESEGPSEDLLVDAVFDCQMSGRVDNDPIENEPISFNATLRMNIAPQLFLGAVGSNVFVRLEARSSFEVGSSAWLVVEQPILDAIGHPLLVLTRAESLLPDGELDDWYRDITLAGTDALCGFEVDECGHGTIGLDAGWLDAEPVTAHEGERVTFTSPVEETMYDVYPSLLRARGETACLDVPIESYEFVIAAVQP